jgi:WD repeat-containing protein 19
LQLAQEVNSSTLFKECGLILESKQQMQEAADMYERAGMVEKAASIYITSKNWAAAGPLMSKVASAKLHLQFAKVKEAEGRWGEAASAFEAAGEQGL